jgi:hypothetical protein
MTVLVNYQKRKNNNLFGKFQNNKKITLENAQNYIPIYEKFFSLNNTNFNSINLNHKWFLADINDPKTKTQDHEHIYSCKLKKNNDTSDLSIQKTVFIKMAPLLDPYKYLCGKYDHTNSKLFNLPSIDKIEYIHSKIIDPNNSSYIDAFFTYLSSQLFNVHDFIHGLDFYGSYLGIKNNFTFNIIDDLDHLLQHDFFQMNKGKLFTTQDYSHLITTDTVQKLAPIKIHNTSQNSNLSIKSIDHSIFEDIFDATVSKNDIHMSLNDIKDMNLELTDITNNVDLFDIPNQNKTSLKSNSSCSSRTSHTNDDDLSDDVSSNCDNSTNKSDDNNRKSSLIKSNNEDDNQDNDSNHSSIDSYSENSETDSSNFEEETLYATIPKFPVQLICMECCEDTLDSLIMDNEMNMEEWFSALMQIIMTLITYQKVFSFTHNDLHTNNIMYIKTKKSYIYYHYKKTYYKVPTFGRIFKIIDFGRGIYKFNGKIFCSDSFQNGGDAGSQYNTEPYFNDKKPRLEPNFSFDLCRLACSIFDYVVEDFDTVKNLNDCDPVVKLIVEWCIDDNGINVLYKNNGVERYPDFKLYKMIARCVHKHTPNAQLERPEFKKFIVNKSQLAKGEGILNIDEIPCYV